MEGQLTGAKAGTSSPGPTSLFAQRQGGSGAAGRASHHLLGPTSLRFEAETPGHLPAQGQMSGKRWGSVPPRAHTSRGVNTTKAPKNLQSAFTGLFSFLPPTTAATQASLGVTHWKGSTVSKRGISLSFGEDGFFGPITFPEFEQNNVL